MSGANEYEFHCSGDDYPDDSRENGEASQRVTYSLFLCACHKSYFNDFTMLILLINNFSILETQTPFSIRQRIK